MLDSCEILFEDDGENEDEHDLERPLRGARVRGDPGVNTLKLRSSYVPPTFYLRCTYVVHVGAPTRGI